MVSARLVKLKAQLVGILYMLPEKPMRWVDRDADGAPEGLPDAASQSIAATSSSTTAIATISTVANPSNPAVNDDAVMSVVTDDKGEVAVEVPRRADAEGDGLDASVAMKIDEIAASSSVTEVSEMSMAVEGGGAATPAPALTTIPVLTGTVPDSLPVSDSVNVPVSDGSIAPGAAAAEILSRETKVERKLKRRLKRKQHNERIINLIQCARTPQELLDVLIEIEEAIPKTCKYHLNDDALPSTADTCAALAIRIYVLDRRIRYGEIKEIEKQGMERQYRPRYQFAPRCMMSSACTKYLSHTGKCLNESTSSLVNDSKIPEIIDPPVYASYPTYPQRASTGYVINSR